MSRAERVVAGRVLWELWERRESRPPWRRSSRLTSLLQGVVVAAGIVLACNQPTAYAATIGGPDTPDDSGTAQMAVEAADALVEEPLPAAKLRRIVAEARGAASQAESTQALDALLDYRYVARWSAGRLDAALNDAQKDAMVGAVRERMLGSLHGWLGVGSDKVEVRVDAARFGKRPGYAVVPVDVSEAGADSSVVLEFHMYLGRDGWKTYDVSANGASATAFYRQYFGDLIRRHGPEVLGP